MKDQKAKMTENQTPKGKFSKRKNSKIYRGNGNFGPDPGEMVLLEGSKGQNERK